MADKIWRFLSSTRLALFLLIILTLVSVIGIIIPQELPSVQYLHKLGGVFGKLVLALSLDRIFSASWFYVLLGFLMVNLIACIFTRLMKNLVRSITPSFFESEAELTALPHHVSFTTGASASAIKSGVGRVLKKSSFKVVWDEKSSGFCAKKGVVREIGSIFFHFSIIFLFIGGLIGKFGGFSYVQELKNGETQAVWERPFFVRSDGFSIETNDEGQVKSYKTRLSILAADSSLLDSQTVEVNHPLTYDGVRFYQSSYGRESERIGSAVLRVSGTGADTFSYIGSFPFEEPSEVPGTHATLTIKRFLGDFILEGEDNRPALRSNDHNNPAVQIAIREAGTPEITQWIFQNYPDVHPMRGKYQVTLLEYEPLAYTGLQVKNTPGVGFVWAGILIMSFGLLAMFYISKCSVWVLIREQNGKFNVSIGGMTDRAASTYKKTFEQLCAAIQNSIEEGGC